jgi:phenylacetate-CoA ligase
VTPMKLALSRKNLWEHLPASLKPVVGSVCRSLPAKYLLGRHFRCTRAFLQDSEWWPAERAQAFQLGQLRRILAIAHERTAFYRRTFSTAGFDPRDLRSIDDLVGLPTIDRQTVSTHLGEMCATPARSTNVDYTSTGGSSGPPLGFYIGSQRSGIEYAYLVTSWERAGFRLGIPLASLRGRLVQADASGLHHEYDPLLRHHYYSNLHLTDDNAHRYLKHIGGIGPCFLHLYPSSAAALANFVRRTGIQPPPNVRGILAGSENVYPEQRRVVTATLNYRYFSWYGLTEKVVLAAECEHSDRYHVWPTYGLFELLDDDGFPITTPGRRGEIVGTGFINTVVPFIRYRTGDYATYVADHCPECKRVHPIISDIRGHRIQEVLVARDGSLVTWTAINVHDDTFDRILHFQLYQDTPGRAVLRIVPANGFGPVDRNRLLDRINRKLKDRLEVALQVVDSIPLTRAGKVVYVDQRIAAALISDLSLELEPDSATRPAAS